MTDVVKFASAFKALNAMGRTDATRAACDWLAFEYPDMHDLITDLRDMILDTGGAMADDDAINCADEFAKSAGCYLRACQDHVTEPDPPLISAAVDAAEQAPPMQSSFAAAGWRPLWMEDVG